MGDWGPQQHSHHVLHEVARDRSREFIRRSRNNRLARRLRKGRPRKRDAAGDPNIIQRLRRWLQGK